MSNSRFLKRSFALVLFALFLTGCNGALFGPTLTPTPVPPTATFTPVPPTPTFTPVPGPKIGRWMGSNQISFTVTSDGTVIDFKIKLGSCTVTSMEEFPIVPDEKFGTFAINPDKVFQGNDIETGSDFSAIASFESDTTASGTYFVQICGGMMFLSGGNSTWTAEWQAQ